MVATPASATHLSRWIDGLAFLEAYAVPPIGSVWKQPATSPIFPASEVIRLAYQRSPGVDVVRVEVEMAEQTLESAGDTSYVGVTLSSASLIGTTPLDAATPLSPEAIPSGGRTYLRHSVYVAYLDVSAVNYAAISDITFGCVPSSVDSNANGFARVHAVEVPHADLAPSTSPTDEVGVDIGWADTRRTIVDGSTTNAGYGIKRLIDRLDGARTMVRRHWQLATVEDTGFCWSCTATVLGSISWFRSGAAGLQPSWYMRARRLYDTATANVYTLRVTYASSDAAVGGQLRLVAGGTNNDITLPAPGDLLFHTVTVAASVPTSTTDQEVAITIQATTNTAAKTLYISQVALIETEV